MKPKWQETARGYGFGGEDVSRILGRPRPELTPEREAKLIDKVIEDTVTKLTSQQAHFTRSNLVQGVCMATVADGISPERIHERAKVALQGERFVALGGERERYTTKEIFYDIEQKALDVAERLGEKATHMVRERTLAKAIARKPRLNEEQRAAVETVCRGPDLTLILGPPGSGKSTLLEVARKAIEKEGGGVIGLAPSNRAARELEKSSGIKSHTVHRFVYDQERTILDTVKHHARMVARTAFKLPTWKQPKLAINRRTTLVVDEAAMVDNAMLSRALSHAEKAGCRVVLVGDNRQLPAILQGGLFRELYERARPDQKVVLTEIMRQREAWAREAISQVGQGEAAKALKTFEEKNRLHVLPTRGESERGLIDRWKERGISDPQNNLILASTNAEVARLNREAKGARLEAGKLGLRSVEVGEERVHEGDRILFTDTKKSLGLVKSEFATVTHIDWLTRKLTVEVDGEAGRRRPITFSLREFDAIRLGYAATVHRAQGMTLDQNVYTLLGGSMQNREMTYVQISRARGETHLFSDEKTAGQDRDELTRMVSRSEEKLSAHAIAREKRQEVSRDERREMAADRRGEREGRHRDMRDPAPIPKEVRRQRTEREQHMELELML